MTSGRRLFGPSTRYRRMPSSLRTTRTQPAPTTRRKGTRSFPGLHAADDTCPGLSAGVCIRYTRVRMPVAHKGEWRPSERAAAASKTIWEQVGKTSSQSKFDPHTLEKVSPARQGCSAWVGSRSRGKDYSFRGTSSPRPPPSHQGDDTCNCNWRADDRPRGQDKARSPPRVPSATSRHVELPGTRTNSPPRVPSATSRWHVEQSSTRTSAWADMRWLPARRQVAGVPHWHAQRLLTHPRGDTAVAPALGAPAQGAHTARSGFLVLKTLTEATAPCSPGSSASSRGHGPFGCPGRQCPLRWPACLGVSSL